MVAAQVTKNNIVNMDVKHPSEEIVHFTTAESGDYHDCEKLRHVNGAFACQTTTDGVEIQVSWSKSANGVPRVVLTFETGNVYIGYLTIFGSL